MIELEREREILGKIERAREEKRECEGDRKAENEFGRGKQNQD